MAGRGLPMTQHQFYVTLPSNSNPESFPDNSPSKYTVMLSSNIELDGPFEVALADMSIPQTWFNLGLDDDLIINLMNVTNQHQQNFKVPAGHYPSLSFLITEINHGLKNEFKARETKKKR